MFSKEGRGRAHHSSLIQVVYIGIRHSHVLNIFQFPRVKPGSAYSLEYQVWCFAVEKASSYQGESEGGEAERLDNRSSSMHDRAAAESDTCNKIGARVRFSCGQSSGLV